MTVHNDSVSDLGAQPDTADQATEVPSLQEHTSQWWAGVRREFTPPSVWHEQRPSLRATWLWAKHGEHVPDEPAARQVTRVGACIALPIRAVALYLDWLAERPSRLLAAVLLTYVLIRIVAGL